MVIEDLVSTGGSSLTAVNSLRNAGAQVEGMCALFTYAFDVADIAFAEAKCNLYTIGDYPSLIKYAIQNNIIAIETESQLNEWRKILCMETTIMNFIVLGAVAGFVGELLICSCGDKLFATKNIWN